MTDQPDHLFEPLEADETVPPRAEEEVADATRGGTAPVTPPPGAAGPAPTSPAPTSPSR